VIIENFGNRLIGALRLASGKAYLTYLIIGGKKLPKKALSLLEASIFIKKKIEDR
jgi:hypothetical protein